MSPNYYPPYCCPAALPAITRSLVQSLITRVRHIAGISDGVDTVDTRDWPQYWRLSGIPMVAADLWPSRPITLLLLLPLRPTSSLWFKRGMGSKF